MVDKGSVLVVPTVTGAVSDEAVAATALGDDAAGAATVSDLSATWFSGKMAGFEVRGALVRGGLDAVAFVVLGGAARASDESGHQENCENHLSTHCPSTAAISVSPLSIGGCDGCHRTVQAGAHDLRR